MLKILRNFNVGWMLVIMGIIAIASGVSMTESNAEKINTFLCFDRGCIYIQGFTNIGIGILSIGIGLSRLVLQKKAMMQNVQGRKRRDVDGPLSNDRTA